MNQWILTMSAVGALAASMALAGCDKAERQDAKHATSDAIATTEQKAKDVGNDAAAGLDKAKDAAADATAKLGDKIDDAVITTRVNAEFAKDEKLSALNISVDTAKGRVALKGTAPSTAAREHATTLARNVKGVVSVDNQLKVEQ